MRRLLLLLTALSSLLAAPPDRITRPVDARRVQTIPSGVHRLAQPANERGVVEPSTQLDHVVLTTRMTASQQADLQQLLADQQNPASPHYRRWLTPEEFGERFGLSASDHSKLVAWLTAEGLQVKEPARSRNHVAFSGTAAAIERALRTPLRWYSVDGETHRANAQDPSVPEALAGVIEGFIGLDDFPLRPQIARAVEPNFTSGSTHYLAPEDFATIYNLTPLQRAGLDGTGQSIVVVGQSAVTMSDMRAFRTRFNLPANDPRLVPYSTDPGVTSSSAQMEANLDLQWAGAIAPRATIYYVYGTNVFNALIYSVSNNIAPVISISWGGCETDYRPTFYRALAQQANAQGITMLASSGDSGAAGCDRQGTPIATRGRTALFPTALPEITSVGGTQFVEGEGRYWAPTNSPNGGSALSYIPEKVWNETGEENGILSGGGGSSAYHAQPAWQRGAGLPASGMRQYPDVSFTAALHDGYLVVYSGGVLSIGGTSASAPAAAGLIALLNQHQVSKGFQSRPGLGNINPQLYRLAQAAPSVFHDTVDGDNIVPCAQGTPDCLTGIIGDRAAAGYDVASGLGSIDADELVKNWNLASKPVTVSLVVSATRASVNDTIFATALVQGAGAPTGRVEFSLGGQPLGSAELSPRGIQGQAADIEFPLYRLGGIGAAVLTAQYSGDAAFNAGGATRTLTITAPFGAAAVTLSAANTIWPSFPDAEGPGWQTQITVRDFGTVPSIVTGFRIDGEAQPLSKYFPTTALPARGTLLVNVLFRKLATPRTRKFEVTGVDAEGGTWTRSIDVNYLGTPSSMGFYLTATPLTVNRTADPACEWPVRVQVEQLDGRGTTLNALFVGGLFRSDLAAVFGTDRLAPWGSLQGTVCFNGIVPPATSYIQVNGADGFLQEVLVSFAGPAPAPSRLTAAPAAVTLAVPGKTEETIQVNADPGQQWSLAVYPMSRMAGWLTVTPQSGVGPGRVTLSANGAGYGPGAYRATIVIQSPNAAPQTVTVPIMFVRGAGGTGATITSVSNSASGAEGGAPGMLLTIYGSNLVSDPLPQWFLGVSAAVNGIAAKVLYASPTQVNIQIPYEAGAGPAVVGIQSPSGVVGAHVQIAPANPGVFADAEGGMLPKKDVDAGEIAMLYLTGGGIPATVAFTSGSSAAPPRQLPLSITVAGVPVFIDAIYGSDNPGIEEIDFIVPDSVPAGLQPLVVTVAGVTSKPVTVNVRK